MSTFNKIYKYSRIWILLIVAILLPKWIPNRYYQGVVNTALIFAILSMSLNTLSGCTGLFCVGFVAFYGIGAYGAAILTTRYGWPILLSLLAGGESAVRYDRRQDNGGKGPAGLCSKITSELNRIKEEIIMKKH